MAFAVSAGALVAIHRPTYQAPTSLRISDDRSEEYAAIYAAQPSVRTVVDFLARNIAQLAIHTFERVGDADRKRLLDHPYARMMRKPNPWTTQYRLIFALVADRGIYDRALWLKVKAADGSIHLVAVPPERWKLAEDNWLAPTRFLLEGSEGKFSPIPAENVVYFRGYNPKDPRQGLSPIESLRRILSEEYAAGVMREQTLRNGARLGGYITRPVGSTWSDTAFTRFQEGWRGQYSGQTASEGGGTPILEDGMQFIPAAQNAVDLQYVEARKLSREEVASAYHIPPPMVGILDHATFGNITEQHKMLYQDTLGPWLQDIQQEIQLQLISDFENVDDVYSEFNMAEKLRGSFEEQAAQLQTSVGAPFLTRNEARARANLPRIEGADDLVVPLNVLIGGQASPTDSAPATDVVKARGRGCKENCHPDFDYHAFGCTSSGPAPIRLKTRAPKSYVEKAAQLLRGFFEKQERSIRSVLGAKADADWWNGDRWDEDLSGILYALSNTVTGDVASRTLAKLGIDADEFNSDQTLPYLLKVAQSNASSINAVTQQRLAEALEEDAGSLDGVSHVFEVAKGSRADQAALTVVTAIAGFATVEAVGQVRGDRKASKEWVVTSGNPRPSHAAMAGEVVDLDDTFSNGAKWPGDSGALDVADVAGCSCDTVISFE